MQVMASARARLTFLCFQDFANVSTEIAHALRTHSERWDARVLAFTPHAFGYARKHDWDFIGATQAERDAAEEHLMGSSAVVWAEEAGHIGDRLSAYSEVMNGPAALLMVNRGARRYTFHAGIAYRTHAERYNVLDGQIFHGQLCSPDLVRLAPRARTVWGKPMEVDLEEVDRLWKARRAYGKIVVTHSPSNLALKGTEMIRKVMANVMSACPAVEYREIGGPAGQHLSNEELMQQRSGAVLHIDQYHVGIGGAGIASYEALARGTLSLASMNKTTRLAYQHWGFTPETCPIIPLLFEKMERASERQTERALTALLTKLGKTSLDELEARGRAAAQWTQDHLSAAPFVKSWEAQLDAIDGAAKRAA